ncbi:glycosyl hydrolase 115 family protein [Paenibacillus sp. PR3]|uniref:Glycosyl hydrolase 115 family protein n=1 Tax=Paenibacillus terricola TaxID=2763503 RepID=A0ABR8MX36_9BACL|nr:glycosyl hydrolase 115 family protein [Paenibacillus terricola]MBD3919470.1 glycosyl hydrolase 115 family protein [Paenibacillus terricola]
MNFTINQNVINESIFIFEEKEAYAGVRSIAEKIKKDIDLVFGVRPTSTDEWSQLASCAVIYGTIDKSPILDSLSESGKIDIHELRGKNEVYLLQVVEAPGNGVDRALVIAGSDKRGTIYGLFRLSEMLGVSPYVNWSNVPPKRLEEWSLDNGYKYVSKEPSVRYRGFFINDEWPAFGTWVHKRFGGFNAEAYDHVFELLLRLKGNYIWPAMWSARFYDDGPGLANAELADEYGVVVGASHHEPCLRQGEEYKYVRGKDSIYGDAWNFRTNEEGITRFWADGLKRSGKFDNVITVGMRGEADTAIMGKEATFADNIELLRDVLRTQNHLIKEHVNPNLDQVPRMLALYKEVEPFFYGDEQTPGLIGSKELEDVILMLCDDNFGNLRTLPTEAMRSHPGGYGMYYHFDYHGGPISYEWINSSYLPKVWEQMSMAYDFGVRELWVVNVGDIATQEFPLAYFLDLAYDFDRWGTDAINKTHDYTRVWIEQQFGAFCDLEELKAIHRIIDGYTRITHNRKAEAMNADVYHPVHYQETDRLLSEIDKLMAEANALHAKMNEEAMPAFFSLVYYPAMGNLNLQRMHLLAGKNHYAARLNRMEANQLAEQIRACMQRDEELVDEFHAIDGARWYGMGLSEHIGFTKWNEDECRYPILMQVIPARKPRLSVSLDGSTLQSEGSGWHLNKLYMRDFKRPDATEATFTIYSLSDQDASYEITCESSWVTCSSYAGKLDGIHTTSETITVRLDRNAMNDESAAEIEVKLPSGVCTIIVDAQLPDLSGLPDGIFVDTEGYISIEAEHYCIKQDAGQYEEDSAGFQLIEEYGRTLSAMKVFPTTRYFTAGEDAPYLEYQFVVQEAGDYEVKLYMQPSNPVTTDNTLHYGIQANEGEIQVWNTIVRGQQVSEYNRDWATGVLDNIRRHISQIVCQEGRNQLRIYAVSPGFVLEKLVIYPVGKKPAASYLGPTESYYVGKS